ncbi:MAG: L-amino acid N-acyltransferase YncA [Candidatus Latescibacterota bacterium]|jgi:L-amino acid N-acyltransferase YncA
MSQIRAVETSDAAAIAQRYNHFVANTIITFEEELVTATEISARIAATTAAYPYLVREDQGTLCGYAYGSVFRSRPAYRFTVETTV